MRKGQMQILKSAKSGDYNDTCIQILSREDMTIRELKNLYYELYVVRQCSEDYICKFISLLDNCRKFFHSYLSETLDFDISVLDKFSSEEKILNFYSDSEFVCKSVDDAILVSKYGIDNVKAVNKLRNRLFDIFDELNIAEFRRNSYLRFICNKLFNTDHCAEFVDYLLKYKFSEASREFLSESEMHFVECRTEFRKKYFFNMESDYNISDDIASIDFKGCKGYIYHRGAKIDVDYNDDFVTMKRRYYDKIYHDIHGSLFPADTYNSTVLSFSYKTETFLKGYTKKSDDKSHFVPAKLRDIFDIISTGRSEASVGNANTVIDYLCRKYNTFIFKDLYKDYLESGSFLPPIMPEEAGQYKTKQQLFEDFYYIPVHTNWNKRNVNLAYCICKLYPRMTAEALRRAVETKKCISSYHLGRERYVMVLYLWEAFYNIKNVMSNHTMRDALMQEYINKQICLDPLGQTVNRHNEVYDLQYAVSGPFHIRKNTKFQRLIDNLPEEYELISAPDRLTEEGQIQHCCVGSYYKYIASDKSMIYSIVYNKRRHTIEFCIKDGKYIMQQCLRFGNQSADASLVSKTEKLLAEINKIPS